MRGADGKITRRQVDRSTGCTSKHEARERVQEFTAEYAEAANRPVPEAEAPKRTLTFADAVGQYIGTGNSKRYLEPIVRIIGLRPAKDIDQETILDVVARLYPNCKASTTNRQVYTPTLAVLKMVGIRPNVSRPKGHDKLPVVDKATLPPAGWFDAAMEHLSPSKRACMLLINLHGLRISEAAKRTPADVDPKRWTLTLPNSKDGKPYVIQLCEPVAEAIREIPNWRTQKWLFGTGERGNIGRAFRKACEKANVKSYGTHRIGATHSLRRSSKRASRSPSSNRQADGRA